EVRIQTAIRIHARIEKQAEVVAVRQDSIDEFPTKLAELLFALGIPEEVLPVFAHRNVGVHAAAVDADDRLGQEAGGEAHVRRNLPADQLLTRDLGGPRYYFSITVVDLKLRWRDFRVILFILEAHGALHFGRGVNERAQRIAGQRVVVAAGIHVLKLAGLMVPAFGVGSGEEKALDFVGSIEGVAFLVV